MSPPDKPGGADGEAKRDATDADATETVAGNDAGPSPSAASEKKRKRRCSPTPGARSLSTGELAGQTRVVPNRTAQVFFGSSSATPETSLDSPRFGGGGLAVLVASRERCELRPKQFFVAWSGALTLAWRGFPPEIEALKRHIASTWPALGPENPGSRWAKTTLGCLRDTKRLTPESLELLGKICDGFRDDLCGDELCGRDGGDGDDSDVPPATPGCVPVDTLSVVTYECRSLERVVSEHIVRLRDPGTTPGAPRLSAPIEDGEITQRRRNLDPPSAAELAVVEEVVAQFSNPKRDKAAYFFDAARDGSRESHYRGTKLGATLVARVGDVLPSAVKRFRRRVDDALPGMYAWFDQESLHCTVRGLMD